MTAVEQMLYNLQKFQILTLFTSHSATNSVTDAYAYAWDRSVFPIGQHGCDWHIPHEESFKIGRDQMDALGAFLDELEGSGKTITFYQLEDHYNLRSGTSEWDRMGLIFACRYFRLNGWFTEEFWKGMAGNSDCPSESHSILRDFTAKDVYFE